MDNGDLENQNISQPTEFEEQFVQYPSAEPEPQYAPPIEPEQPAPTTNRPKKIISLGLLGVVLVVCAAVFSIVSEIGPADPQPSQDSDVSVAETYNMKDRPRYPELVKLINSLYDRYTSQDLSGEIWARFNADTEDYNYVIDFLSELNYYHKKLAVFERQQGGNPDELDYEIEYILDDLYSLETKFIAKAPLTTSIIVTREDGTEVAVAKKTKTSLKYGSSSSTISEGSAIYTAPDLPTAVIPLEKEEWARSFQGSPGADGTYRDAAAQLAEHFDMYLDYKWSNIIGNCTMGSKKDDKASLAAYCHATPDVIYVNKNSTYYAQNIRSRSFVGAIKHEISHHIIANICGTASPPIVGANTEGVTNSYANIFMGANLDNSQFAKYSQYLMTDETERIARILHDEKRCN